MKLASINLFDQNFYVLCILAMRLHKAPREVTHTDFYSVLPKVISLGLV